MKKRSLRERIRYWLDCMMSKGPIAMSGLLFVMTASIVILIGLIASFISDEGNVWYQMWFSLMYTLDPGNLSGVPTDNLLYLFLMFLATLCGLFLTSLLIGVIATGVEAKLSNLRMGKSVVQEDGHTVIIGFDNNAFAILKELVEANENQKDGCIVVLGEQKKEAMEEAISARIPDSGTTRIICRSGHLHETYALERCSLETCKSVIINVREDAEVVKILLALATYVKNKTLSNPDLKFVASLQDDQYMEAATIAGEGRAAIVYSKDAIARIIANTCRQHGLSQVLTELFNFTGNELYYEKIPQLVGKSFREATMSFSNAVVVGLRSDGKSKLNPPMDTVIGPEDELILLELDDGSYQYHPKKEVDDSNICRRAGECGTASDHLIILGSNDKLPIVLTEYNKYVEAGTKVVIIDDQDTLTLGTYSNLDVTMCRKEITRELLFEFVQKGANNILLLNDDSQDAETSDSQTLLRLLLLRDIADSAGLDFAITTEMRSVDNQRLASRARVDDFVIGSNFASLIMAQISENYNILSIIDDLLDAGGSEMYMKPVENYVSLGVPVDSYILTESAARKGEIFLGYRKNSPVIMDVVVNPEKGDSVIFEKGDQVVVIAQE